MKNEMAEAMRNCNIDEARIERMMKAMDNISEAEKRMRDANKRTAEVIDSMIDNFNKFNKTDR